MKFLSRIKNALMKFKDYSYFISETRSGKVLSQSEKKKDVINFSRTWIEESPYYDSSDPIVIKEALVSADGTVNIIRCELMDENMQPIAVAEDLISVLSKNQNRRIL